LRRKKKPTFPWGGKCLVGGLTLEGKRRLYPSFDREEKRKGRSFKEKKNNAISSGEKKRGERTEKKKTNNNLIIINNIENEGVRRGE